jgi:hypothetical protein
MYYNFVRIHKTLRTTPAMAAGVTSRLWEIGDIVDALEAREASSARAWTMYPVFGHRNINRRIGRPLLMLIPKNHTRFIRFRALPADEVTLLILRRLSLQSRELPTFDRANDAPFRPFVLET